MTLRPENLNARMGKLFKTTLLLVTPIIMIGQAQSESIKLVPQLGITSRTVESFSVSSDGKYALTGDWDGILRLWDVESGYELKKLVGEDRQSQTNNQSYLQIVAGRFAPTGHQILYWEEWEELGIIDFENPSKSWSIPHQTDVAFFIDGGNAILSVQSYGGYGSVILNIQSRNDGSSIAEQTITIPPGSVESYAVVPKENLFYLCLSGVDREDSTAIIGWDYKDQKIVETYFGVGITDIKVSPSGKKILGIGEDFNAYVWNRKRPNTRKRYGRENNDELQEGDIAVRAATFLKEDNEIALELNKAYMVHINGSPAFTDPTLVKWNIQKNKIVEQSPFNEFVKFLEPSEDSLFVLTGQNSIEIWNTDQWEKVGTFKKTENNRIKKIELSSDERLAMIEFEDAKLLLLDLEHGDVIEDFQKQQMDLESCFSPDGKMIAIGDSIFSTRTGQLISTCDWWYSFGFFEDTSLVLALEHSHNFDDRSTVSLVDALSGEAIKTMSLSLVDQEELKKIPLHQEVRWQGGDVIREADSTNGQTSQEEVVLYARIKAQTAALSPDQKILATTAIRTGPDGVYDMSVRFWDFDTGEFLYKIKRDGGWVDKIEFSKDGSKILISAFNAEVWSLSDRKLLQSFGKAVSNATFVNEDKEVLVGFRNGNVALYSLTQQDSVIHYKGSHLGGTTGAVYLGSKNRVLSVGDDAIVRMFDARKGDQKLRIFPRTKTDWAVIDSDGRFDYGNPATDHFIWEYQNRVYTIDQLRDEYYEPKLFAKYLGTDKEPLQDVERLSAPAAYPNVESITKRSNDKIVIHVSDEGDGIGKVPVYINGREFTDDARKLAENEGNQIEEGKLELTIDLRGDARIESTNQIEVIAYDENNYVSGRGETLNFSGFGSLPANREPPNLHAVIVGVSDYRGDKIDLRYAAKDAEDFAAALKIAASRLLLSEDKIKIRVLSTTSTNPGKSPGKTNIITALEALEKTKQNDIVVVYFAGHGVIHNSSDDYYFLTKSAASANLSSQAVIKNDAISSKLLASILRKVPAKKRVLIFDTCGSGKLIEDLLERSVPSSQIRAIEDLNRRTGFHVLAGSTADQLSYEAGRFSQGILTHTILTGIRGGALIDGQYVDVQTLFEYCRKLVPDLALGVGGIQRPQYSSPEGGQTFNIGRLEPSDLELIVVQESRPVFIRPSVIEMNVFNDRHGLSNMVAEALRNESHPDPLTGRSKIIYSGASNYPDSYQIAGPYSVNGDIVKLDLKLLNSKNQVLQKRTITGKKSTVKSLILKAVGEMVGHL